MQPSRWFKVALSVGLIASLGACNSANSLDRAVSERFQGQPHTLIAKGIEGGVEWRVYVFDKGGRPGMMGFGAYPGGMSFFARGFEVNSGLDWRKASGTIKVGNHSAGAEHSFDAIDGYGPPEMAAVRLLLRDGTVYRAPAIRVPDFDDVTFFAITGPGLADLEFESITALDDKGNSLAPADER